MDLGLIGRVAIVTGASQGIGRVRGRSWPKAPMSWSPARIRPQCGGVRHATRRREWPGAWHSDDLTQDAFVRTLFERTLSEFGSLDILVNNAAVVAMQNFSLPTINDRDVRAQPAGTARTAVRQPADAGEKWGCTSIGRRCRPTHGRDFGRPHNAAVLT